MMPSSAIERACWEKILSIGFELSIALSSFVAASVAQGVVFGQMH